MSNVVFTHQFFTRKVYKVSNYYKHLQDYLNDLNLDYEEYPIIPSLKYQVHTAYFDNYYHAYWYSILHLYSFIYQLPPSNIKIFGNILNPIFVMASSDICVIVNFTNSSVLPKGLKSSKCYVEYMSPTKFKFFTKINLNIRGDVSSRSTQIKGLSYSFAVYDKLDEILADYIKWIKFKNPNEIEDKDIIV